MEIERFDVYREPEPEDFPPMESLLAAFRSADDYITQADIIDGRLVVEGDFDYFKLAAALRGWVAANPLRMGADHD